MDYLANSNASNESKQLLANFWPRITKEMQTLTNNDFKNVELPLARIKKIMKLDDDVKMISAEAPIIFAKAAEIFIQELTLRAWLHTEENKRRTLQRNDTALAISKYDQFDFLIDIVPREEINKPQQQQQQQQTTNSSINNRKETSCNNNNNLILNTNSAINLLNANQTTATITDVNGIQYIIQLPQQQQQTTNNSNTQSIQLPNNAQIIQLATNPHHNHHHHQQIHHHVHNTNNVNGNNNDDDENNGGDDDTNDQSIISLVNN